MSKKRKTSLRVVLDNWLDEHDFSSDFKHPEYPLEVDIGSGKGRFLIARSGKFPETNFLGIERQMGRVNRVGVKCERRGRENVQLFRMEGYYAINCLMPSEKVSTYYFFFPDPWPKDKHHDHRLFNAPFMDALHRTLIAEGVLHIATDHLPYYEEIYELLTHDERFEEIPAFQPDESERTDFELMFAHKQVGRCSFKKKA